jgi:hypothetical protein
MNLEPDLRFGQDLDSLPRHFVTTVPMLELQVTWQLPTELGSRVYIFLKFFQLFSKNNYNTS